MKKILLVGGSFDTLGGKPSGIIKKIDAYFASKTNEYNFELETYNGGNYNELQSILEKVKETNIVLWWANVPNDLPKIRAVKEVNYKVISVTSKRNVEKQYSYQEILQRMLEQKANLSVIFEKDTNDKYKFKLSDPLGNLFYDGGNVNILAENILKRAIFLSNITRASTTSDEENKGALAWYFNMFKEEMYHDDNTYEIPEKKYFLEVVKDYAEVFAKTIFNVKEQVEIKRFLGNASFRCPKGFPSFREGEYIFVSRRNVDKTYISINEFIPTYLKDGQVYYLGDNKPSVDSPVQLKLYKELPNIKYMIHAHVYIKDAPMTSEVLPCGALEEVDEILNVIKKEYPEGLNTRFAVINLLGHGCLMMSDDVSKIDALKERVVARPKPEII